MKNGKSVHASGKGLSAAILPTRQETPFFERNVREIPDIEQPARAYAERRGWLIEKVVSQSRKGWPDRLCIRNGRVIFVEFKAPDKPPKLQQLKRHREIREHGGEVFVIDNLDAAYELFR